MSTADKKIILGAFVPGVLTGSAWRLPEAPKDTFLDFDHYRYIAEKLEAGRFHALFFNDGVKVDLDPGLEKGANSVRWDPLILAPLLAKATSTLNIGVTASVTYAAPYDLARRFATLDALTDGRIAWNVVTSYQESAARNLGLGQQLPHDQRYDRADEYMDVVYSLWEGSYADDAYVADAASGVVVDPEKVKGAEHSGEYFDVQAPALVAPTPQRTPFLFQAGASPRGLKFAAKHAEAVFFSGPTPEQVAKWTAGLREAAAESFEVLVPGLPEDEQEAVEDFAEAVN